MQTIQQLHIHYPYITIKITQLYHLIIEHVSGFIFIYFPVDKVFYSVVCLIFVIVF